jgi:hypothetical protein
MTTEETQLDEDIETGMVQGVRGWQGRQDPINWLDLLNVKITQF